MKSSPRISVVITAHNSSKNIGDCLTSLKNQNGLTHKEFEILLIDDRSTDNTTQAAISVGLRNLSIYRIEDYKPGNLTARQKALDLGFKAAKGEIIFLLDSDGKAPPDWIRKTMAHFEKNYSEAVAGPVEFRSPAEWIGRFQTVDVLFYLNVCRILNDFGFASGVLFGNFAFKRSIYFSLGKFDAIGFALTEDLAFSRAFQSTGNRLFYQNDTFVSVNACANCKELIHRSKRVSTGGWSALSVFIGVWMLILPLFAAAAVYWGTWLYWLCGIRYGLGVGFLAYIFYDSRHSYLLPYAFFYEPLAIFAGLRVMKQLLTIKRIEWGGIMYDR